MSVHPDITIRFFGSASPVDAKNSGISLPDRATVLLAMLIVHLQGSTPRNTARALLWEDAAPKGASANLRWLISVLRKAEQRLEMRLIHATTATIAIDPSLRSDVQEFLSIDVIESPDALDRVFELYCGAFLSGLTTPLGPELQKLLHHHRINLRRKLMSLAPSAEVLGRDEGKQFWDHLFKVHPDEEEVFQGYLQFLARSGGGTPKSNQSSLSDRLRPELSAKRGMAFNGPRSGHEISPAATARAALAPTPNTPMPSARAASVPRLVILPPNCLFDLPPRAMQIAEALIEDVTLSLCRMRSFAMLAPFTAQQVFRGVTPASQAAADYVVYTSLVPSGSGDHRLTLTLVRTATGEILVGDEVALVEADLPDRFADIAGLVARHISDLVENSEIATYRTTGAASAYVHFLLGSRWIGKGELGDLRAARKHFSRAVTLAPDYTPAIAGLARCFTLEWLALRRNDDEFLRKALQHAKKAVDIDPLHPNGWRELAHVNLYLKEFDQSLDSLQIARGRARHHADILADQADVLVHMSRMVEAKAKIEEAITLNPAVPDDYHWVLGSAEFFLGDYQAALGTLLKMRRQDEVSRLIAAAAAMAGDAATASAYRRKWLEIYPDSTLDAFADFMPHRNRRDVEHYLDALRRAGFS